MPQKIMEPYYWTIESLFKKFIYAVPVYQRPYSWEKIHIDTLMDDIFGAYDDYKNQTVDSENSYFIGNIIIHDKNVTVGNGLVDKYEVIDGQQRITTLTLILLSIYSILSQSGVSETERRYLKIKDCLWKEIEGKNDQNLKVLTLNSIEKDCADKIFNKAYSDPVHLMEFIKSYSRRSRFEGYIIDNFINIYQQIKNKFNNNAELLDFVDYFLTRVNLIAIGTRADENKVFSMFESINSKGKRLDEIDLIKSYIFSELDSDSYQEYLDLWGQLIISTNDQLYDYLQIFIKSYLKFFRQDIKIANFKLLCKKELQSHYNVDNIADGLKNLLSDMNSKAGYYKMLASVDDSYRVLTDHKFRFYHKLFTYISYVHPRPLFFRIFNEFSAGNLSKNDAVDIIVEIIKYMILFTSISNQPSKEVITLFSDILFEVINANTISREVIINRIAAEALNKGINQDNLKQSLRNIDAYEKSKKITIGLLSLYEATEKKQDGSYYTSYDQAYALLNNFSNGDVLSLDHLLVQSPEKDDDKFKYYKIIARDNSELLALKDGHDFPEELVNDGMDYHIFTKLILNKIGNLRLYYKDLNSRRNNSALNLKDYDDFNTYEKINNRNEEIAEIIIDKILTLTKINIKSLQTGVRSRNINLPKIEELLKANIIKIGDKLVINSKPDDSEAELIGINKVKYHDEEMTLNDWGCKVTGWKSINIYMNASIKGESETLQQKREGLNSGVSQ